MLFFDLMAVFFFYKAMKNKNGIWSLLVAILFTFLASFSKGIQGLFPIAVPLIYSLVYNHKISQSRAWLYTLIALISISIIYCMFLLSSEARESYRMYFEQRFTDFPKTKHANTDNRFKILYHIVIELAIPILFCVFVLLISRLNMTIKPKLNFIKDRNLIFFLLVGISASFPLIVTFEQRGFYLNTSLPYYALALACISLPWLNAFQNKFIGYQRQEFALKTLLISTFLIGIMTTVYCAGRPKRDADKLHDINLIAKDIGVGGNVCTTHEWDDWSMRYYFARYHQIGVTGIIQDCPLIVVQHADTLLVPPEYHISELSTKYYTVYRK